MNDNEIRNEMIKARDEYINIIRSEILGPGSEFDVPDREHELISSSPESRYSAGILFPQGNLQNQDNDETVPTTGKDNENKRELEDSGGDFNEGRENNDVPRKIKGTQEKSHTYDQDETADENLDEDVEMASQYMPSSAGITFLVKGNTDQIHGKLTFATYRKAILSDCIIPYMPADSEHYRVPSELANIMEFDRDKKVFRLKSNVTGKEVRDIFERDTIPENEVSILKKIAFKFVDYCRNGYVRVPHEISDFILDFSGGDYADNEQNQNLDGTYAKIVALRKRMKNGTVSVTVMIVNDLVESPVKAYHCIYQAQISVSTLNNNFVFYESNSESDEELMDKEEQSLALLYRHKKNYATGLGTSADWNVDPLGQGKIWSEYFPVSEIPSMSFFLPVQDKLTDSELSMKYLSDLDNTDKDRKLKSLTVLVDLYKEWVIGLQAEASRLDARYQSAAVSNLFQCKAAYERMYSGINTLRSNDKAYMAFALANRAMFMQRVHLRIQGELSNKERYPGDEEVSKRLNNMNYETERDSDCRWRPFQIAFLLMDVNSISNDSSPERKLVDLIWFPTGGGKTEAYLGLTAFSIFYRRLAYPDQSGGTTVIMRYTLRLLAAQQFTRAATLICACEYIRNDSQSKEHRYKKYELGKNPITIGLWIGGTHIPNKVKDAEFHLKKLNTVSNAYYLRNEKERHNKFQVLKCPWCGTKMVEDAVNNKIVGKWGYNIRGKKFYMFCPNEDCNFTARLPIQIIDENLYENPPTLLFGTVDKFAMLPWDGRTGAFFACGENNRPPELIIQDELHLISGALGTMVGLYETAIDALCERKAVYPKIIASTATIRRAKEQCSVLYNREVVQFPAPGLDAEDSFFAKEAKIDYTKGVYGRKYVGIIPSGKTKAMMEIRMLAALLQKIYSTELPYAVKDKFWTLTAYFNSLRDLGKASTMVEDDVKDFIVRTANRMFRDRRLIIGNDELTSRVSTTELNETLDKLEKTEYSEENIAKKRYASNILLATNMISVGIDIARLNVMLMVGQPKLTSEYIQASSRVGRAYPGIVMVQYDATKSRDRSHYEGFRAYHDSFYRFVEPTGATPFSKPARERGLYAVLLSIFRQRAGMSEDGDAQKFDSEYFNELINKIEEYILDRINGIHDRADNALKGDNALIKEEMDRFFDFWQEKVENCRDESIPLYFGRRFMVKSLDASAARLLKQYNSTGRDDARETLTSMRNVDKAVTGKVIIWEEQ